jgi:hypothetical protein
MRPCCGAQLAMCSFLPVLYFDREGHVRKREHQPHQSSLAVVGLCRAARLPYTLSRDVDEIGLMVDEPKEFLAQLERGIASSRN